MAVIHSVYTFDFDELHLLLMQTVVDNNKINLNKFQKSALAIFENASPELKSIFDEFRLDRECLEDPEEDTYLADHWYMTHFYNAFKPCPSLSNNRNRGSFWILEHFLPLKSWHPHEVRSLIRGDKLEVLFTNTPYAIFRDDLSIYGGCLSVSTSKHLLDKLSTLYLEVQHKSILDHVLGWLRLGTDSDKEIDSALLDGIDMLKSAVDRNETLYLQVTD